MRNRSRAKTAPAASSTNKRVRVDAGSGNVFADLGLPNPNLALVKADLVQRIRTLIAARKLPQAAALLGLGQPKVSALLRGGVEGYSLDRLLRFLTAPEIAVRQTGAMTAQAKRRSIVKPQRA